MAKNHSGGKVSKAGQTLSSPSSSKRAKSQAGKALNQHKQREHK